MSLSLFINSLKVLCIKILFECVCLCMCEYEISIIIFNYVENKFDKQQMNSLNSTIKLGSK